MNQLPVILGVSGASGAAIALSVARQLQEAGVPVELVVSPAARTTLRAEIGPGALKTLEGYAASIHDPLDIGASIASGSTPVAGMIIAPCSMRSLGAIAHSLNENLLIRAADVQLKERRPLVLVARETPLHLGHLRNMTAVSEMGGIILPPVPAFYLLPKNLAEVIDQIAARAIDLLRITDPLARAWGK